MLRDSTRSAISGIVQVCAAVLLFLALQEQAGVVGDGVQNILKFFFGKYGMIFPAFLLLSGFMQLAAWSKKIETKRSAGLLLCLLAFL